MVQLQMLPQGTLMHDMMIAVPLLPKVFKILNLRGLPGTTE